MNSSPYILLIVVGLIFGIAGVFAIRHDYAMQNACTEEVSATVVDIKTVTRKHTTDNDTEFYYYPVFQYEYDNTLYEVTYELANASAQNARKFEKNPHQTVYINPNKPTQMFMKNNNSIGVAYGITCMGFGAALIGLFFSVYKR